MDEEWGAVGADRITEHRLRTIRLLYQSGCKTRFITFTGPSRPATTADSGHGLSARVVGGAWGFCFCHGDVSSVGIVVDTVTRPSLNNYGTSFAERLGCVGLEVMKTLTTHRSQKECTGKTYWRIYERANRRLIDRGTRSWPHLKRHAPMPYGNKKKELWCHDTRKTSRNDNARTCCWGH